LACKILSLSKLWIRIYRSEIWRLLCSLFHLLY